MALFVGTRTLYFYCSVRNNARICGLLYFAGNA
jgi:hypothetical protein